MPIAFACRWSPLRMFSSVGLRAITSYAAKTHPPREDLSRLWRRRLITGFLDLQSSFAAVCAVFGFKILRTPFDIVGPRRSQVDPDRQL